MIQTFAAQKTPTSAVQKTFLSRVERAVLLSSFFVIAFVFVAVHVLVFTAIHNALVISFQDAASGIDGSRSYGELLHLLWDSKLEWKSY